MSGEKTKATLSWELNTVKAAAKSLVEVADVVAHSIEQSHPETAKSLREQSTRVRALVDGAAKEGAA